MKKVFILLTAVSAVALPAAEPVRVKIKPETVMPWAPRTRPYELKDGWFAVEAGKTYRPDLDGSYIAGQKLRFTFSYRSPVRGTLELSWMTMETPAAPSWHQKGLPPVKTWKEVTWDAPAPQQDLETITLRFRANAGKGRLEVKDLEVREVPSGDPGGKPLLVEGRRAEEVCLYAEDTPARRNNDMRAARMFRFALRRCGGEWLPVREVKSAAEASKGAVLIGRLAVDAGVVDAAEARRAGGLTGGWAVAAKGGRLGIAGAVPGGVQRGARSVLERLGIVYLGADAFRKTEGDAFSTGAFSETRIPATAFPLAGERNGLNIELRGWIPRTIVLGNLDIGSMPEGRLLSCDSLGWIVSLGEFRETHPEFFAMLKDGRRLTDMKYAKGLTHFCWTAPGLADIVAERYKAMMRACPERPVWLLAPGDGGDLSCTCASCKALGSDSDGLVRFANHVAAECAEEFPENRIFIYSYVDTPEPPKNRVELHPNVYVGYCVYPSEYWPSCMLIPHRLNALGEKALAGWRKEIDPRLSLVAYYSQCGDWKTFWPGFDADVWLTKDFGRNRNNLTYRFGLHTTHRAGVIGQASSFVDLIIYVISRLEVDPSLDETALAHEFISAFYGPAAEPMRKFFEIARAEPAARDWVQGCEQRIKGFVTKEFCRKAMALLDEAERLAGDDRAVAKRVRAEKANLLWTYLDGTGRGRGNISRPEVREWAGRVAEFCRICRDDGASYMGSLKPEAWFRDNCLYETGPVGSVAWPKSPRIKELIADPVKALGEDFPNHQRKTADGYEIPATGMNGGQLQRKCFWCSDKEFSACILRRDSSGYGLAFTRLDLDEVPAGEVRMVLRGIDNEKASVAEAEVKLNDTVLYSGPVRWGKTAHSDWELAVPKGLLRKGANDIQIRNITADTEKDGEGGDRFRAVRNYFWGWFMLDSVRFTFR